MEKNHLIERIMMQTLDNKEKVSFLFLGNKSKIKNFFDEIMRIFRKKISEGFNITADYYLIDFYTYMMICEEWSILDLHNELFKCKRCDMAVTKHLYYINNDLISNQVNDFLDNNNIGL